jgi:hypothetical protein
VNLNAKAADVRLVMFSMTVALPVWVSPVFPLADGPLVCTTGNAAVNVLTVGPATGASTYNMPPETAVSTSRKPMMLSSVLGWMSSPLSG